MKTLHLNVARALVTVPCDVLHFYVYNESEELGIQYFDGYNSELNGLHYTLEEAVFYLGDISYCEIYTNFSGNVVKEIHFTKCKLRNN